MKYLNLHPWNVNYKTATEIQEKLEKSIILKKPEKKINMVAGADVSYLPERRSRLPVPNLIRVGQKKRHLFFASIIIFELQTMERVEAVTASGKIDFPYIPGLLSFRESPILLKAISKIKSEPDVIILDAQGIAHPRGIGLASHIGLLLDKPSIGCAKTRLIGEYSEVGENVGNYTLLKTKEKTVGAVLRTRKNVKPVFISPGHKIDLNTSIDLVLKCCRGYRLPEPVRQAHNLVKKTATGKGSEKPDIDKPKPSGV